MLVEFLLGGARGLGAWRFWCKVQASGSVDVFRFCLGFEVRSSYLSVSQKLSSNNSPTLRLNF